MSVEKVAAFRNKHHKCVFCTHLDTSAPNAPTVPEIWWCEAKLKSVTIDAAYRRRLFCSCYEARTILENTHEENEGREDD